MADMRERLRDEWLRKATSSFTCQECGIQANFIDEIIDALDAKDRRIAELEAALSRLERYVAMEAMDRLIEEGGRAVGWEKSHQFSALLDETRQILIPAPPSRIDKEDGA